jgi:hypothetical protein
LFWRKRRRAKQAQERDAKIAALELELGINQQAETKLRMDDLLTTQINGVIASVVPAEAAKNPTRYDEAERRKWFEWASRAHDDPEVRQSARNWLMAHPKPMVVADNVFTYTTSEGTHVAMYDGEKITVVGSYPVVTPENFLSVVAADGLSKTKPVEWTGNEGAFETLFKTLRSRTDGS